MSNNFKQFSKKNKVSEKKIKKSKKFEDNIRNFWNNNPLCASRIPYKLGTQEYFKYYDKLREDIEDLKFSYKMHEYKKSAGKKVLDVGCGNGYILSKYAKEGAKVFGIDITSTAVSLCRRRFKFLGIKGDFREASAEKLPFKDKTFDYVCSMGVLHHVANTEKAVKEIFRVTKPGGRVIIMVYHRNSALYKLKLPLLSFLKKKTMQQLVNELDGIGNPKGDIYSITELKHLLNQFKQLETIAGFLPGQHIFPIVGKFIPTNLLKLLEKKWGCNLYAKGIKPKL